MSDNDNHDDDSNAPDIKRFTLTQTQGGENPEFNVLGHTSHRVEIGGGAAVDSVQLRARADALEAKITLAQANHDAEDARRVRNGGQPQSAALQDRLDEQARKAREQIAQYRRSAQYQKGAEARRAEQAALAKSIGQGEAHLEDAARFGQKMLKALNVYRVRGGGKPYASLAEAQADSDVITAFFADHPDL